MVIKSILSLYLPIYFGTAIYDWYYCCTFMFLSSYWINFEMPIIFGSLYYWISDQLLAQFDSQNSIESDSICFFSSRIIKHSLRGPSNSFSWFSSYTPVAWIRKVYEDDIFYNCLDKHRQNGLWDYVENWYYQSNDSTISNIHFPFLIMITFILRNSWILNNNFTSNLLHRISYTQ